MLRFILLILVDPIIALIAGFVLGSSYLLVYKLTRSYLSKIGKDRAMDNELRFFTAGAQTGTIDTTISTTERMRIETDGEAHFDGDVVAFSSTVSDKRLKENVIEIDGALDTIHNLRGVTFNWKEEEEKGTDEQIGFIAQEVEKVYPQLVEGEEGNKSVNVVGLVSVLTKTVQELTQKVEELEKKSQ